MFKNILFYLSKLFSSKFVLKGSCNKCGQCCRNIVFYIADKTVQTEAQFDSLKKFSKSYNHFFVSGKDEDGALLFTCKSLKDDNSCADYLFRSIECRRYPRVNNKFIVNGGELLEGCGFKFAVDKNFNDYLKQ